VPSGVAQTLDGSGRFGPGANEVDAPSRAGASTVAVEVADAGVVGEGDDPGVAPFAALGLADAVAGFGGAASRASFAEPGPSPGAAPNGCPHAVHLITEGRTSVPHSGQLFTSGVSTPRTLPLSVAPRRFRTSERG